MPRDVIDYVKYEALTCIGDQSNLVRAIVGTLIAALVHEGERWPELWELLMKKLDSDNYCECDGSFSILQKINEDNADILDNEIFSQHLNLLIPKFFQFFSHNNGKFRSYALSCLNNLIISRTQIMMPYVDIFIEVNFYNF